MGIIEYIVFVVAVIIYAYWFVEFVEDIFINKKRN
jgi:hypothetical protein